MCHNCQATLQRGFPQPQPRRLKPRCPTDFPAPRVKKHRRVADELASLLETYLRLAMRIPTATTLTNGTLLFE